MNKLKLVWQKKIKLEYVKLGWWLAGLSNVRNKIKLNEPISKACSYIWGTIKVRLFHFFFLCFIYNWCENLDYKLNLKWIHLFF